MEKNKTCERNWINKGSFKQYSVCSAIIQSHIFARINGIANCLKYQLLDITE